MSVQNYEDTVTEVFEIAEDIEATYVYVNNYYVPGEIRINDVLVDDDASELDWEAFMAQYPEGTRLQPRW